ELLAVHTAGFLTSFVESSASKENCARFLQLQRAPGISHPGLTEVAASAALEQCGADENAGESSPADLYVVQGSEAASRAASGSLLAVLDAVLDPASAVSCGMALTRPP
ncbi:unnamed protein product, partial [Polarella glacialis]